MRVVMRNNKKDNSTVRTSAAAAAAIISRSASSAKLDGSFSCFVLSARHCADGTDCTSLLIFVRHSLNAPMLCEARLDLVGY